MAEFLLSKMNSHPDFAGMDWATPHNTVRNRSKSITTYNAYYSPPLPLPPLLEKKDEEEKDKRAEGITWDKVDPAHADWGFNSDIIAKIVVAVEATYFKEHGQVFNARETAAKAAAFWETIDPEEFSLFMKRKREAKRQRQEEEEEQGKKKKRTRVEVETVSPQRRCLRNNPRAPRTTRNQNAGGIATPSSASMVTPARQQRVPFTTATPTVVSAVAPAAPAPVASIPLAALPLHSYAWFHHQQYINSLPRLSYEERRAIVHQNVLAAVPEQPAAEQQCQTEMKEEDGQDVFFPDNLPNPEIYGLDFEDILNANIVGI